MREIELQREELFNRYNQEYILSEEESKRISILKVWLTVMVLFIHSYSEAVIVAVENGSYDTKLWLEILKYTLSQAISRCAVPGFFIISAILLYKKPFKWKDNIKKKAKTLLVPYVILNGFWILFFIITQNIPSLSIYFPNEETIVANWGIIQWIDAFVGFLNGYPMLYPLWFVRDLFVLNLLAILIKKIIDIAPNTMFLFLIMMWLLLNGTHLFFLDIQGICFWGFGYLIVKKNVSISSIDHIRPKVFLFIYIVLIILDVATRNSFLNLIVHRFNIIVGILFWFSCMTKFKTTNINRVLLWFSSFSFSIYLFHEMNLTILKKICASLLPSTPIIQAINYIIIPFIIIFCCIILSLIMEKIMPKLYMVLTGNRSK